MSDVYGLLGGELGPIIGSFKYSEEDWDQIKVVVVAKLSHDADKVTISYPGSDPVPLRTWLEMEIGIYQLKMEIVNRYPPQTTRQILPKIRRFENLLRALHQALKTPEVALYALDWGRDRGGPKAAILLEEELRRQVKARAHWLSRTSPNEPYPGPAAPSDVAPAEGWQKHHRELTQDPEADLVRSMLRTFVCAFKRKPGLTRGGAAFRFLHATLQPVFADLTESRIWHWLRSSPDEF